MKNTLFNKAFGGIKPWKLPPPGRIHIVTAKEIEEMQKPLKTLPPGYKPIWLTKEELEKLYPPKRTMFQGVVIFIKKLFKK